MPEIGVLQTLEAVRIGDTAIRDAWRRMARFRWFPGDTADYTGRVTVSATVDAGTIGEVRARVVSTGRVTLPLIVTGPTENRLLPYLVLGKGEQFVIVEARRVVGDGALRILAAAASAIDTALVGETPVEPAGEGRLIAGGLVATAEVTFDGATVRNTATPAVTVVFSTPAVGATLEVSNGSWSEVPAAFEYQWETV